MPGVETANVPIWIVGFQLVQRTNWRQKRVCAYACVALCARMIDAGIELLPLASSKPSELLDKPYVMLGVPLLQQTPMRQAELMATQPPINAYCR